MTYEKRTRKVASKLKPTRRSLKPEERDEEDAIVAEKEFEFIKARVEDRWDFLPMHKRSPEEIRWSFGLDLGDAVDLARKDNFRPLIALLATDSPYADCMQPTPRQQLPAAAWDLILAKLKGGEERSGQGKGKRGPKPKSVDEKDRDNPVHRAAAKVDYILYLIRNFRGLKLDAFKEEHWEAACSYAARLTGMSAVNGLAIRKYLKRSVNDRRRMQNK